MSDVEGHGMDKCDCDTCRLGRRVDEVIHSEFAEVQISCAVNALTYILACALTRASDDPMGVVDDLADAMRTQIEANLKVIAEEGVAVDFKKGMH